MKKKITFKVLAIFLAMFLNSVTSFAAAKYFAFSGADSAIYNNTLKAYELVGVGEYYKSTSGGTVTLGTASCDGYNKSLATSSSLFLFKPANDLDSIVVRGTGSGSNRIFSKIESSTTLAGTYTAVTATATGGIGTGGSANCGAITIKPATQITGGTYLKLTFSGNLNVTSIILYGGLGTEANIISFTVPNALSSTITGNNIAIDVPNTSDVTALIPTIVKSPGSTISPDPTVATDFTSPVSYTVTSEDGLTINTYTVTLTKVVPSPTISTPSNISQSVKQGVAIAPIVFTIANGVSGSAIGLPSGVTFDYASSTISGTPDNTNAFGTYNYSVGVKGNVGANPDTTTVFGTITVKDPAAKTVAFVYNAATANTALYNELNAHYDVTVYQVSSSDADTVATSPYMTAILANDLIVIHELPSSSNITMSALGRQIGKKPMLNTKSHMYGKPNWPAGSGNNGVTGDTCVYVSARYKSHPIFTGVTFKNDSVVDMATGTGLIRGATGTAAETATKFDIAKSKSTGISIIETNDVPSAKYMMIALAAANETLSSNGLQVLKNACDYLMGSTVFAPAASQEAVITSFKIGAVSGTVDETAKTISITLPKGTDVTSLSPVVAVSKYATITAPASLTAVDFTNPVSITVQAEDILVSPVTYVATVNLALGSDTTLNSLSVSEGTLSPVFSSSEFNYTVVLPFGTTTVPAVSATATDAAAQVQITDASSVSGIATVLVTSEDANYTATYTIQYSVALALSTDTTLNSLSVSEGTMSPAFDPSVFEYAVVLPFGTTAVPTVSATATDAAAQVQITDASSVSGVATVLVTAEDANYTATYTIQYSVATSLTEAEVQAMVIAKTGEIVINGAEGAKLTISSIAGTVLFAGEVVDSNASYKLSQGMYIVTLDGVSVKAIVK